LISIRLSGLSPYWPVVVVMRNFEALDIVSPKERLSGNTYRCAEPGMRAVTKTRGVEFGTRSVKFFGKMGNWKPPPILV
jgi:hypothetical protein